MAGSLTTEGENHMASVRVEESTVPYIEGDWDEVWAKLESLPPYTPRQTMAERIMRGWCERAMREKALALAEEAKRRKHRYQPSKVFMRYAMPIVIGMGR